MTRAFPTASLLPKEETLADKFLELYPQYDGRNTVVAIFDTGVDPGAIGLQTTTDGKPKVIDILDATGAGDVDTSLVLEAKDGKLTLANGKVLTLNPEWTASVDGKYHVGTVAAYHLFPGQLVNRLKKERKEKFDIDQRNAVNDVQNALAAWSRTNAATTNDVAQLRVKKDLQARLSALDELAKSYEDPGPIYDAIVFFDGTHWRAALDVAESGDFTGVAALTNYKIERQYATFSKESQLNYALNIYDDGNTLSIVSDVGAHGTHVAGIVAAHHPDQPLTNGVAPGAQIISVKIGDGRLGSMETTTALSRAILAIIEAKADVVNMSYGEYASEHDYGRIVELAKELVEQHNVTFVTSAGNNGPALGSVGAPGGTSSCMIGVGAYVSPKMMDAEYIMRENDLSGITYTWSSRGPTFDGDLGVDICAPGAAIAPVPNWTLNKKQLMNGTSMSSPNCAGNIALLISALKDKQVEYTPYSIRRALEKTAVVLPNVEVFAQGKGLIQVLPAFEYLNSNGNSFDGSRKYPLEYAIKTSSGVDGKGRGVYLRDAVDFVHDSTEVNVTVTPVFHKLAAQEDKVHFELHLKLVPSERWIDVGRHLALMHEGRGFKVLVNTKHLPAGVNSGEIAAYDANNESRGPVFKIPVTVIKPEQVPSVVVYKKALQPGDITRRFFTPPTGTTWADVILSRPDTDREHDSNASGKLYMFHVMQFQPFVRQSQSSFQKAFFLRPGEETSFSFDLMGDLTAEFALAQFWSALGDSIVQVEVRFHGIVPDQQRINVSGGVESHKVLLSSTVEKETIAPSVSFTKWTQRIRPKTAEITPLSSDRDQFPDKRQVYQLVLTYPFTAKDAGKVVPRLPLLNGRLYESPFESQLSLIFDDKKQYLGTSDSYGDAVSIKKGSYVVRTQVRHEDISKLEKLKQMVLLLEHDIKEISASVYGHQDDVAVGGKALDSKTLPVNTYIPVFVGEPSFDKLPAGNSPGDLLTGKIYFGKKNGNIKGSGRRPGGFDISYVIPPAPTPAKEPEPEEPKDERDEEVLAQEAVRDLLLGRVTKLAGKKEFLAAWQRLADQFPTHLPVVQAKLHHFDSESDRLTLLSEVVEAADAVLALIKQDDLALFFGTRSVPGDAPAAQKKLQKEKEKEKEILVDALNRKTRALGDAGKWDEFLATYAVLQKWADVETNAFLYVNLLHDRHHDAPGLSLQRLRKVAELETTEKQKIISEDKLQKELLATLNTLKWTHWSTAEQQWHRRRTPASYRKF
ncbi:Tripeptidyl-peptidase 2, partial [Globisporangium splendens]